MIQPLEMTCQELVELVTEYLEGVLPDPDRRRFDEHLEACPYCVAYVEQMRTTVRLTGRLGGEDLQGEAIEKLLAAFGDWKRRVQ